VSAQRIQRRRAKGYRLPKNAVYVGRPTRWGNPFLVTSDTVLDASSIGAGVVSIPGQSAEQAVARYRAVALGQRPHPLIGVRLDVDLIREQLAGKNLACWCPLDQPCHADVLLELANQPGAGAR
jgi:hypothetical protein